MEVFDILPLNGYPAKFPKIPIYAAPVVFWVTVPVRFAEVALKIPFTYILLFVPSQVATTLFHWLLTTPAVDVFTVKSVRDNP